MYAQHISWFWPLTFLITLGQLLLLMTRNEGGPAFGRLLLAVWTLWVPGVWLGNLLTKPRTGLPARLPLQAGAAMAVSFVVLAGRAAGWYPADAAAFALTLASVVIGFVFLVLPGSRGGLRRSARWEAREVRAAEPQVMAGLVLALALVVLLGFIAQSPLSLRPDGADQVGAARLAGSVTPGFPAVAWHDHLGLPGSDPHRSLAHGLVDLLARMSQLPHHRVWDLMPVILGPLLLLSAFVLGRVVFRDENLAVASAVATLLITTGGFSNDGLRTIVYPDRWAMIPYWTAIALFLDGLDRPHPRTGFALGLLSLAVFGTHLGVGFVLVLAMLAIGTFTWLSVDRFIEGIPLLLVLWAPVVILSGGYLLLRAMLLGGLEPNGVPALGLLLHAPGRFTLDATQAPTAVRLAALLAVVGLASMWREATQRIAVYYFAVATLLALGLGFVPWITPAVERGLGPIVHLVPRLCPLAWILVAVLAWAVRGLLRSEGYTWLRFVTLALGVVVTIWLLVGGLAGFAYTPGRLRAQRADGPEALHALADSLRVRITGEPVVLSDAASAAALAALTPARSLFVPPDPRAPRSEAWRRYVSAREALTPPASDGAVGDSLRGLAEARARDGLAAFMDRESVDLFVAPRSSQADRRAWRERLEADPTHFNAVWPATAPEIFSLAFAPPNATAPPPPAGRPGAPRPPASFAALAPAVTGLEIENQRVAPGDTLRVRARWAAPAATGLDPRGYRIRVEVVVVAEAASFWRAWPRRVWRTMTGPLFERGDAAGAETPIAAGTSPARWSRDGAEIVRVPLPTWLRPGAYELRARALPGPYGADRVRGGVAILPPSPQPVLVTLVPAGR